jgi:hypothetical protein
MTNGMFPVIAPFVLCRFHGTIPIAMADIKGMVVGSDRIPTIGAMPPMG